MEDDATLKDIKIKRAEATVKQYEQISTMLRKAQTTALAATAAAATSTRRLSHSAEETS